MSALPSAKASFQADTTASERSYPFPVWSGLLSHRAAIGSAIWTFLWFLDRVTADQDGWGIVLGGRPVKDAEIANRFKVHRNTIRADREVLVAGNYVQVIRTPYGFTYRVRNSRKFGIWGKKRVTENCASGVTGSCASLAGDAQKSVIPDAQKTVETKKTMQLDHAVKQQPAASSKAKDSVWGFLEISPCGPGNFRTLLESRWASRNGDRPSVLIGETVDAWEAVEGQKLRRTPQLFSALADLRKKEQASREQVPTEHLQPIRVLTAEEIPA